MTQKLTRGVHHVGLTVPDLDQARAFFCGVLGFDEVGGVPSYPAIFVSDGAILLTLWRAADPDTARAFDRRANIGLHHLSLAVADDDALDALWAKVSAHPQVVVDAPPSAMRPGSATRHFLIFIPGGIRIEFATPFA
ncbi:catechol 2,3-dioxygenase-like lactoylglutathione lyase family enzyme [Novosphingobium chloroacetimidivorans]|uniref:Catechol 2,3-dioxygenase-like lactoylglutathione lyase family enzyme n=1 Tax=Novosphingobium chloroacetimidivorans TaxID=1428314 RepID=A0A7W7K9R7_9SPHN|nr:VOC family protein [Novosphingobium chloroacetimidivorans]MBB4858821.1 catechol 2,3-dioxygenase-like lactoylglutathione lyase family enzyme [Novosphingobium chloroacetimidivorans]